MSDIPKRDINGQCQGECRDRVNEGKRERQEEINKLETESPQSYPNAPKGKERNEQPGVFGGHV